jgi:non-ribosomal peptide synthetase component F
MSVMFRELLTRIPDIHATAEPQRLQSMFINGIKHLPVAFTPAGAPADRPHPRTGDQRRRSMTEAAQRVQPQSQHRTSLDYPEVPVGAVVAGAARRWGDRVALHFLGRELTFAGIYERACAFANALRAAGVGRGDVVALHLPNCPQYPIAYYGTLLAGATFSPTNRCCPRPTWPAQLADCGAVAVVSWVPAAPGWPPSGTRPTCGWSC